MPVIDSSSCRLLSSSPCRTLTHSGCSGSASFSRTTRSAFEAWLVTRMLLFWASRCPIRLAMVWLLPVPGGPCTSTAPVSSRRRITRSCSAFAGLVRSTSMGSSSSCSSPRPVSMPATRSSDSGSSVRSSRLSSRRSMFSARPWLRLPSSRCGWRNTTGPERPSASLSSSTYWPWLQKRCTRSFRKALVRSPPRGWKCSWATASFTCWMPLPSMPTWRSRGV